LAENLLFRFISAARVRGRLSPCGAFSNSRYKRLKLRVVKYAHIKQFRVISEYRAAGVETDTVPRSALRHVEERSAADSETHRTCLSIYLRDLIVAYCATVETTYIALATIKQLPGNLHHR
jgi:hypothetical protein